MFILWVYAKSFRGYVDLEFERIIHESFGLHSYFGIFQWKQMSSICVDIMCKQGEFKEKENGAKPGTSHNSMLSEFGISE